MNFTPIDTTRPPSPIPKEESKRTERTPQQPISQIQLSTRRLSPEEETLIPKISNSIKNILDYIERNMPITNIKNNVSKNIIDRLVTLGITINTQLIDLPSPSLIATLTSMKIILLETLKAKTIDPSNITRELNTIIQDQVTRGCVETYKARSDSNDSSSSSEYEYDKDHPLFQQSIASGSVALFTGNAVHGSLSGPSGLGLGYGFILKYTPNTDASTKKDWIQFISRQVLLNETPMEGANTFKMNRAYQLFTAENKQKECWALDISATSSPFYGDSLKSLPEEGGNSLIFDQPTGWSSNFSFKNIALNSPEGIHDLLLQGNQITSIAEFKSYLCTPALDSEGAFSFKISWDLSLNNFILADGQHILKVPFKVGVIHQESIKFEDSPIEIMHQSIITETCGSL